MAVTSDKIVSHVGDLSQPRFGLSESAFAALTGDVGVILHMGAARSLWDNYDVLRASNVGATRELVKLAVPRHVPIHYISSAGMLPKDKAVGSGAGDIGSAAAYVPPTDGSNGYVATRWASEQVLERAAQTLGVPASIYRFVPAPDPQQPREQGDDSAMKRAALDELVRFVDVSGRMPDFHGWEGRIDMIPAEQAAEELSEAVVSNRQQAHRAMGGLASFKHCECPISLDVAELKAYLEQQRGRQGLERLPGLRWVGRIKALGFGYLIASSEVSVQRRTESEDRSKLKWRR